MKAIVISSVSSGSGKTVSSLCIEAGLKKLGKNITAFKFGPDFIDPSYHRLFAQCYNLDPVMSSTDFVKYLFSQKGSEYNVIEGAMGLFDGELSGSSTYELSKILGSKIVLCVDVSGMGESIRALVKGLKRYVSGIIAIKVASEQHIQIIKKSLEKEKVELIGYIPKYQYFDFPSRHLGLYLSEEVSIRKDEFEKIFFKFFDVKKLLKVFDSSELSFETIDERKIFGSLRIEKKFKVGILSGSPFSFVYPENIFVLEKLGFEVYSFALGDIPEIDALIIPGGYPENLEIDEIKEIKRKLGMILPTPKIVIAECGGLEILSRKILFKEKEIECLGIFPFEIKIEEKLQALGWRKLKNGQIYLAGHEFRYGRISNMNPPGIFLKYDSKGKFLGTDGFKNGKFLSLWTHLYFGSNPSGIANLICDYQTEHSHTT